MESICLACSNTLYRKYGSPKKYCDTGCQADFLYREYIDRWKSGLENGMKGRTSISNYIRRFLFEKYNNKCARCSWGVVNEFSGRIPLEVEHLDGVFTNNVESNLILICPNCHSLTSTYRALNMGRGRPR